MPHTINVDSGFETASIELRNLVILWSSGPPTGSGPFRAERRLGFGWRPRPPCIQNRRPPMEGSETSLVEVFDVDRIRRLVELMKEHDLSEVDLRQARSADSLVSRRRRRRRTRRAARPRLRLRPRRRLAHGAACARRRAGAGRGRGERRDDQEPHGGHVLRQSEPERRAVREGWRQRRRRRRRSASSRP